jgi:hypothetical protein
MPNSVTVLIDGWTRNVVTCLRFTWIERQLEAVLQFKEDHRTMLEFFPDDSFRFQAKTAL